MLNTVFKISYHVLNDHFLRDSVGVGLGRGYRGITQHLRLAGYRVPRGATYSPQYRKPTAICTSLCTTLLHGTALYWYAMDLLDEGNA